MKFFCIFTPNDTISQSLLARCIRTGLKFGHGKYYAKLQKLVDNNNYNGNAKYLCLPGAVAYTIKPKAAKKLLMIKSIFPLDLFVNKEVVKIDDHQFMSTFKVDNDYTTNR